MTPELQNQLSGILFYLETALKATTDFTIEQAPDVIQQLLMWKLVDNIIGIAFCIVVLAAMVIWGVIRYKEDDPVIFPILFSLIPLMGFCCFLSETLKIILAPKVFLLEYASSFLK